MVAVLLAAALAACVAYAPGYYVTSSPASYDRAWNAAVAALQDAGVRVTSADRASGTARGTTRDDIEVLLTVSAQPDGTVRVQMDAKSTGPDPGLAQRFSDAYERRMGRAG